MADIPLARSDYFRGVAKEARIRTKNRYFEQNPVLTDQQVAMIARMGMRRFTYVGPGPIRGIYSQSGSFNDAVFVVSYDELWKIDTDGTATLVFTGFTGDSLRRYVSMAATSKIGTTPEYLFIADGSVLYLYIDNGYAIGTLSGTAANGNQVRIGSVYYQFTSGSVDAGTPNGGAANPWLVALGGTATLSMLNLFDAIGATGTPGTTYSTALTASTEVIPTSVSGAALNVRSTLVGVFGNATVTTETGASLAWGSGTLTGGGSPTITQVATPDDVGIVSVGYIASYVVCVPTQGQDINGRFYWINPGETTIDALDFATAERAPDPIYQVVVFGDQFWLPGSTTTEVWYFTGNLDAPVLRMQGVVFDQGTWEGTAVQIKDSMITVNNEGEVFQVSGGIKKISRPDIAQQIREAIQAQAASLL